MNNHTEQSHGSQYSLEDTPPPRAQVGGRVKAGEAERYQYTPVQRPDNVRNPCPVLVGLYEALEGVRMRFEVNPWSETRS